MICQNRYNNPHILKRYSLKKIYFEFGDFKKTNKNLVAYDYINLFYLLQKLITQIIAEIYLYHIRKSQKKLVIGEFN